MKYNPKNYRWYHFLAPQHWPLWLSFFLLYLSSFLPYGAMIFLGQQIGRLLERFAKKLRNNATVNIKLCFPNLPVDEQKKLVRRHFESLGIAVFEMALAWWASDKRIRKLLHPDTRKDYLTILPKDIGIIILTGHFTNIELSGRIACMVKPAYIFLRPQRNKLYQYFADKHRLKYFQGIIYKADPRILIQLLQKKETIFYLQDQDFGKRHASIFAPFFGVETWTSTTTARIAQMSDAVLMEAYSYRSADNRYYHADDFNRIDNFPTGDEYADAKRINQSLETAVRKCPEQYFWIFRRFKTRPHGEPSPYET